MIIRRAEPGDEAELTAMIHELAEFERAGDECTVTESQLRTALFGETPTVHGHIAEVDGQAAGGLVAALADESHRPHVALRGACLLAFTFWRMSPSQWMCSMSRSVGSWRSRSFPLADSEAPRAVARGARIQRHKGHRYSPALRTPPLQGTEAQWLARFPGNELLRIAIQTKTLQLNDLPRGSTVFRSPICPTCT